MLYSVIRSSVMNVIEQRQKKVGIISIYKGSRWVIYNDIAASTSDFFRPVHKFEIPNLLSAQ